MKAVLADLIVQMQNELQTRGEGYVQRFEDTRARAAALNDSDCIGQLLPLFDDNAAHDETMFAVIHTIETFDDATYAKAIVDHLNSLFARAPKWGVVVLMRILNSASTMAALAEYVKSISVKKQSVVREAIEAVCRKNAKFRSSGDSLLARL